MNDNSVSPEQVPRCANCEIEIHWQPTIISDVTYCCVGCAEGGPCSCDYSRLPQPGNTGALVLRHRAVHVMIHQVERREIVVKDAD